MKELKVLLGSGKWPSLAKMIYECAVGGVKCHSRGHNKAGKGLVYTGS